MNKLIQYSSLIFFLILPALSVAATSAKRYDRESFYLELKNELDKSLKHVAYTRVEKLVKIDNELAKAQEPWTISNTTKESLYTSNPRYRDLTNTLALKYENEAGTSFQVTADYYNNSEFGTYGAGSRYSRSNYSLSFSQDLVALFKKTSFEINQEVTALQGKAKLIGNESEYLTETLKVADLAYQLFSSLCKKNDLEKIFSQAKETLKSSEAQQAARTISMRDYLRIKGTYLSVQRQIQSAGYEIQSTQDQFSAISDESHNKARMLSGENLVCEEDIAKLKNSEAPERAEIKDIIAKHPTILSVEISKESLKKKFESYKTGRNVKFELNGGYTKVNNEVSSVMPYDQSFIGLTISYQFQGDTYNYYKQSIAEQYQDLSISQKQSNLELDQYLESLFSQLEFQKAQIPLVLESIQTASRLSKIIETQQAIGQVDATAIESAYQGEIQAQGEKRNLWSQISSISLKLQEIKKAALRAAAMR